MIPHRLARTAFGRLVFFTSTILSLSACTAAPGDAGPSMLGEARSADSTGDCRRDDTVFITDGADNEVKRFDTATGAALGAFVVAGTSGLNGPTGLAFPHGVLHDEFLVVSQNVGSTDAGDILLYDAATGDFDRALVSHSDDEQTPSYVPRGVVVARSNVYVADQGDYTLEEPRLSAINTYDDRTGAFLGQLDTTGFPGVFRTRDLVVGPDRMLYASVFPVSGPGGSIARFDLDTGKFVNIVFDANSPTSPLNRPAGLAFDRDGRLYVISNSRDASNPNQIVIFDVHEGLGTPVDAIVFDSIAGAGSELVFGPCGDLFVTFNVSGALRRYDVSDHSFVTVVQPGTAALQRPGYLVFHGTDPATRAYHPDGDAQR